MRLLAAGLTALAVVWAFTIIATPRLAAAGTGTSVAAVVYAGSSRICHQKAERSFRAAGLQWPVCARCAGLYLSGAAGLVLGWFGVGMPKPSRVRWLLALAALPTAVTWSLEVVGLAPFSNMARVVAALPLGAAAGWVFVRMLRYDSGLDARQIHRRRTPSLHG